MTVTNGYCTAAELKANFGIGDTDDDSKIEDAINTASRAIDAWCGQSFYDSGSASARKYAPDNWYCLTVHPFSTTTGLVVATDEDNDGTYETTWASTDYELSPINGDVGGLTGVPFRRIRAVGGYRFPVPASISSRQYTVQVTAQWGWAAVPAPVKQACMQVAAEEFRRKDAPFGVIQSAEFGPTRLSPDMLRAVTSKLSPYRLGSHAAMVR